jgi:hypothetical protein
MRFNKEGRPPLQDNQAKLTVTRETRDEVGIQPVYVTPFSLVSHISPFMRHGLWYWRTVSVSCY